MHNAGIQNLKQPSEFGIGDFDVVEVVAFDFAIFIYLLSDVILHFGIVAFAQELQIPVCTT